MRKNRFGIIALFAVLVCVGCSTDESPSKKPITVGDNIEDSPDVIEETGSSALEPISLSLSFSPEKPTALNNLRLVVESNARTSYIWSVNGDALPSVKGKMLSATWFGKGDEISVKVTAFEGSRKKIQILKVVIENMPPRWERDCRGISGDPSGYRVSAVDPDSKDPVVFSLKGQPKGLSIDKQSGLLSYKGSADAKPGDYRVLIMATDSDGATADHCAFSLSVSMPKATP